MTGTAFEKTRQRPATIVLLLLLLFADEASFAQWGSLGYTWAPRSEQPKVRTTGKRKGYKVMGMIDYLSGRLFFQGGVERLTAARYCAFLSRILAQIQLPVMVIHDGARYHTAAAVRAFVAKHAERLSVHPLPAYSPDYNRIEHLWRNVKRDKTHNRYFPTFEALLEGDPVGPIPTRPGHGRREAEAELSARAVSQTVPCLSPHT